MDNHLKLASKPTGFASWHLKLALLAVALIILAALGHRLAVIDFRLALLVIVAGAVMSLLAVISSLLSIIKLLRKTKKNNLTPTLVGLILGLIITTPVVIAIQTGLTVPAIHDITTDLQDPPKFNAVLALRTSAHNTLERENPTNLAELQQAGYPNLTSILINQQPDQVFTAAHKLVKARGWDIVAASAAEGLIEATASTLIMGFKDDIVIRIRSNKTNKVVVDMRSVSRVGESDLGANAARIEAFLTDLKKQIN